MKNEDYEKAYYDAREILHNRGKKIGSPTVGRDLVRSCVVDGIPVNDLELLTDAWGERLVREILAELAESDSLPDCCPEGNQLWQDYCKVGRRNLEILLQQQAAAGTNDSATLSQLVPALRQAEEERQRHRRSLLEHAATHKP